MSLCNTKAEKTDEGKLQ